MFFIKKTLKLLIYLISPIVIIFILLISCFKYIRFCFLPSHRIGEIAGLTAIYIYSNRLKKNNNNIDIFFSTDLVANKFLLKFLKNYIFILPDLIVHPVYKITKALSNFIPYFQKFIFYNTYKDRNFLISKSKKLSLKKKDIEKGERFLKKIGIPKNSKIACLIVRDKKYLKNLQPKKNYSYHDYRNCNIENYRSTIMYLISKNYYVLRMGVDYENKLKIKNRKFIDYSKNYRSDFLDIYLAFRCNLVITSVTGWDIVPSYFFKKPVLWTNLAPYHACLPYLDNFVFLPKSYYNLKTKKNICPWKAYNIIFDPFNGHEYKKKGIGHKENSPDEIKKATIQILNQIGNKNKKVEKFKKKLSNNMWKNFAKYINNNNEIYNGNKYPKGRFSENFLMKNKKILEIND